jgi:hypothetical protein
MPAREGEAGQRRELVDAQLGIGAEERRRERGEEPRLVEEAHVEGRLGREGERRVAEGEGAEAVAGAVRCPAVLEEPDVEPLVGLVARGHQDLERLGQRPGREREPHGRIHPQRLEEARPELRSLRVRGEAERLRPRRVAGDVRACPALFLVEEGGERRSRGGEERLQRLDRDRSDHVPQGGGWSPAAGPHRERHPGGVGVAIPAVGRHWQGEGEE